jgi:long-chain acyl-CoA synthetase
MPGVAGRALYGMEIELADDGEIRLRSPGVFKGYWRKPEATSDVLDPQGWLRTGDIGRLLPDGNLKVIDRRADLLEMLDGRVIPASEIEHMVKRSPYVREAMLAGSGREFLTVLIEIDSDATSEWARANRILYTSFSSLIESHSVRQLLAGVIAEVNTGLVELGRPLVKDFRILPKELDPEEGDEVTSTNKVRRRQLGQKFDYLLKDMYGDIDNSVGSAS